MSAIRDVFVAALDKPPAEWDTFLDSACGTDLDLRQRVVALLAAHAQPDPVLDRPAADALATTGGGGLFPGDSFHILTPSDVPGAVGRLSHYTVFEEIGRGGMGVVLRAFDEKLHRDVAVKVLPAPLAADETARRRFIREARAAAAVRHENVVPIHAVEDGDSVPYLVMAFVEGGTLQDRIDQGPPLTLPDLLRIGARVADGLAAAHRQGLVHRDVKPANILLDAETGRPLLTDFGLARTVDNPAVTQNGMIAGTPQYMSPEQVNGERVGPRSDLFSLGSVLYAMCAGHPPFRAESTLGVLRKVSDEPAPPLGDANPAVPHRLREIITQLLAKSPDDRFATAEEVGTALGKLLADVEAGRETGAIPRRRFTRRRVALGVTLVVVAVTTAALAFRPREMPPPPPDTPPPKPEWTSLFNGKDLTGWTIHPDERADWTVEEGEIVTRKAGRHTLFTERTDFTNFHLRMRMRPLVVGAAFDFRVAPASVETVVGYNTNFHFENTLKGQMQLAGGSVVRSVGPRPGRLGMGYVACFNPPGLVDIDTPWPRVEVIAVGPRIQILVEGQTVADVVDDKPLSPRGGFGLRTHSLRPERMMDVRFKDIEIKELPAE